MNIDTNRSRVHGTDTPEVKALRARVETLEAQIAEMKAAQKPTPTEKPKNA